MAGGRKMEKAVEKVNQDSGTYQADDFQRQEQESGKWQKGEDSQRCMTLVMAGKPIRDVWLGAVSRTGINRSRGPSRHIFCRHQHQDQTGWMGGDMVEMVRRMLQGGRSKLQEIRGLRAMQRHRSARAALGNMVA